MRTILLCVLVALAGCSQADSVEPATSGLGAAVTVFNSVFTGGGAQASGGDRFSGFFLDVWEDGARDGGAFLNYETHSVDPTSEVCEPIPAPPPPPPCDPADPRCECPPDDPMCGEPPPCDPADPRCAPTEWCRYTRYSFSFGWGSIDGADFAARPNSAALDTNADGPGFFAQTCTVDEIAGTWNCVPSTSDPIRIAWRRDGMFSQFHSGVDSGTYGPYSFRSNGIWRSSSATANGTLNGVAVVDGSGGINSGINVQKSMIMQTPSMIMPTP